ncbi:hypothetical protein ZOSMA_8G00860 [Zostera marina]|uniref:Uncharacterized protein n=1 Tax=Zostera marina TaxID=29655 RepID=A0A0K9NJI9_ZOSMR|nr:hypothetical protein ZOSMA_8G00860 [Zostera marina]
MVYTLDGNRDFVVGFWSTIQHLGLQSGFRHWVYNRVLVYNRDFVIGSAIGFWSTIGISSLGFVEVFHDLVPISPLRGKSLKYMQDVMPSVQVMGGDQRDAIIWKKRRMETVTETNSQIGSAVNQY